VSDRTGRQATVEVKPSPGLYDSLTPRARGLLIVAGVFLLLFGALLGHILGRELARLNLLAREETIQLLQAEGQKLKAEIVELTAQLAALQAKLAEVQAALEAIMPTENTYNLNPNQSLVVADGRLTLGLVGSPTNRGINININGKPYTVVAGDAISVAPDPSTTCLVRVQSFDMFKALLNASCTGAKPR
jgi:cell division protein FtsB